MKAKHEDSKREVVLIKHFIPASRYEFMEQQKHEIVYFAENEQMDILRTYNYFCFFPAVVHSVAKSEKSTEVNASIGEAS